MIFDCFLSGLSQQSYSTLGPVSTGMGDRLQAVNHLGV